MPVVGTQTQVNQALDQIKQRFPPRQFPGITFEQLNVVQESPILPPEIMQVIDLNMPYLDLLRLVSWLTPCIIKDSFYDSVVKVKYLNLRPLFHT